MPVHFLRNRNHSNKVIPEFGALRLGTPKKTDKNGKVIGSGDNIDHFRVDFKPHYEHLNIPPEEGAPGLFDRVIGAKPKRLEVELVGNTPDDVFPTWYKSGTATRLLHMCDGVTQSLHWDDTLNRHSRDPIPCVGGYEKGYQCKGRCKLYGELHVSIPKFNQAVGKTGKFVINTTSFHNVDEIYPRLEFLFDLRGSLMFMPAVIGRYEEEKTYPADNGRAKRAFHLMYIEFDNELMRQYIERQNQTLQMLPKVDVHSLPAPPQDQLLDTASSDSDDEATNNLDIGAIASWLQDELHISITVTDVATALDEAEFVYDENDPNAKLDAIAYVLEYWCQDPETFIVVIDDIQTYVNTLFKDDNNRKYIMDKVIG